MATKIKHPPKDEPKLGRAKKPISQLEDEVVSDIKAAIAKKKPGVKPKLHTKTPTTNVPRAERDAAARQRKADEEAAKAEKRKNNYKWPPGKSANPTGRPPGSKSKLTIEKIKFLAATGQTPLEFLTAVYRDQLYADYDVEIVDAKKGLARCTPRIDPITGELDTAKVEVKLEQRISAASQAAPYVHRKMPIGIDGGAGKPLAMVSTEALAKLSEAELTNLLNVMSKLGISSEFEGRDIPLDPIED